MGMVTRSADMRAKSGTPLLRTDTPLMCLPDGGVEATYHLDAARDLYLLDHCLDGRPVLPMAIGMELMAEVVAHAWPSLHIARFSHVRMLQGVKLEPLPSQEHTGRGCFAPCDLFVTARPSAAERSIGHDHIIEVTISGAPSRPGLPRRPHYRGTVALASQLPAPPAVAILPLEGAADFPLSVPDAYDQWLFHGPRLAGITELEGVSEGGMTASLRASSPGGLLIDPGPGHWQIDPVIVDSVFQLMSLWTRYTLDMSALPNYVDTYRFFAPLGDSPVRCEVRPSMVRHGNPTLHADVWLVGARGRLLGLMESVDVTFNKALNRFTGIARLA